MRKEFIVINGVLLVVLIGTTFQLYRGWTAFQVSHDSEAIQYEGEAFGAPLVSAVENDAVSPDWTIVSEQNLFSFDRNDLAIVAPEGPVATGPRPILFGTMSLGDGPVALLAQGQLGNRASRPFRVGQVLDGWTLIEVADKSVIVESGGIRTTIFMNDPTAQVARDTRRTFAGGGGVPVSNVRAAPPASPVVQPRPSRSTSGPPVPPTAITEDNVPPGFTIQRTPFGNRVIPIPEQ